MLCPRLLLLAVVGLTSVSAQSLAFPTTLATVIRSDGPVPSLGPILSAIESVLDSALYGITVTKTTYTGPWTKRDVKHSKTRGVTGLNTETAATATRDHLAATSTTKATACAQHDVTCESEQQPMLVYAKGL